MRANKRTTCLMTATFLLAGCGTMEQGSPNLRATVSPGGVPDRGQTGSPSGAEGALGGENRLATDDPLTPAATNAGGESAAVFPPTAPPADR